MAKEIKSATRIPSFTDDESAAAFFETHDTSRIWETMKPARPVKLSPKQAQAIRERYLKRKLSQILGLDAKQVAQSWSIAQRKSVAFESQLRKWIIEGIWRESRGVRSRLSKSS